MLRVFYLCDRKTAYNIVHVCNLLELVSAKIIMFESSDIIVVAN